MNDRNLQIRKFRSGIGSVLLILSAALASPLYAAEESHAAAYADALTRVSSGQAKLVAEMERVSSGQVAHFDFLQYEHLEILRYARALRFPPAALNENERTAIREHADQLLLNAEGLEWNIADFLRSEALLSSALNNIKDIADIARLNAKPIEVSNLQTLAQAAGEFRNTQAPASLQALYAAIDKADAGLDSAQYRTELATQKKLIEDNAAGPERAMARVRAAGLIAEVDVIKQIYAQADVSLASR